MGWNTVAWTARHPYVADIEDGTRFYFVHSYAPDVDEDVTVGITEHGRAFASAVARDNVFATQFHPEKSGDAGLAIYERFVKAVAA
jgi:glutamine amidotransferase